MTSKLLLSADKTFGTRNFVSLLIRELTLLEFTQNYDMTSNLRKAAYKVLSWLKLRFPHHSQNEPETAREKLLQKFNMEEIYTIPRLLILSTTGLAENECHGHNSKGPLDELSASNIVNGPFKIILTPNVNEHLTFARCKNQPTLRILDLDTIFGLYPLQRTGLATYKPSIEIIVIV